MKKFIEIFCDKKSFKSDLRIDLIQCIVFIEKVLACEMAPTTRRASARLKQEPVNFVDKLKQKKRYAENILIVKSAFDFSYMFQFLKVIILFKQLLFGVT